MVYIVTVVGLSLSLSHSLADCAVIHISDGKNLFDRPNQLQGQNERLIFWLSCYGICIILPPSGNSYCFRFILLLILHCLAALVPLPVDCLSIVIRDLLVFVVCLNFENFRYLYNNTVSCKVVVGKIESNLTRSRIKSFSNVHDSRATSSKCDISDGCFVFVVSGT